MSEVFLEITFKIDKEGRASAAAVYSNYKHLFLKTIKGAESKALLMREDDVQILHGFDTLENANAYLSTEFLGFVLSELQPFLTTDPELRVYHVADESLMCEHRFSFPILQLD